MKKIISQITEIVWKEWQEDEGKRKKLKKKKNMNNKDSIIKLVLSNVVKRAQEELIEVPDLRQGFDYDCGAVALQTVLGYYGDDIRDEVLMKELKTNSDIGTDSKEIIAFAKKKGYDVKEFEGMTIKELKSWIKKKVPVIVAIQAWADDPKTDYSKTIEEGHYVVAIGYGKDKIYFEDPSLIGRGYLTEKELLERWKDFDGTTEKKLIHYGIVITGKEPKYNEHEFIHIDDD